MFTNRCTEPLVISRPAMPLCRDSRSSITSATVAPLASTVFSPPVWVRRMVGMDTVTAMRVLQVVVRWVRGGRRSALISNVGHVVRTRVGEHVTLDDVHVFLGDHA